MRNNHGKRRPLSVGPIAFTGILGVFTLVAVAQAQGDSNQSAPAPGEASNPPVVKPFQGPPITPEELQEMAEAVKQVVPKPGYIPNEGRSRAPIDPSARPELAVPTSRPMQIPPMGCVTGSAGVWPTLCDR